MATMFIYSNTSGYWSSTSATYGTMQSGSGTSNTTSGTIVYSGQVVGFTGYVTDYSFDTSSLPDSATNLSATLNYYVASLASVMVASFRYYQQTAWARGSTLSAQPAAGSMAISSVGLKSLSLNSPATYIPKNGTTYLTVTSNYFEMENSGSLVYVTLASNNDVTNKPYITFTYDVPTRSSSASFTPITTFNMQSSAGIVGTSPNYPRVAAKNISVPNAWTRCTGTMSGQQTSNITFSDYNFPFGTSYVKPVFMLNSGDYGSGTTYASNIVFKRKPY